MTLARIAELEARLQAPDEEENGFVASGEPSRLEALAELSTLLSQGEVPPASVSGGINTHVHTAKSFSYFASPADAVWQAKRAGLCVFGINDHYTVAGHPEFRAACEVVGIAPTFSMEAIAMWAEAESAGATVNDPSNPGRCYLTSKGVTRAFAAGCQGEQDLLRMNAALLERNREITSKLAAVVEERLGLGSDALTFDDVLAQTPHNQPTERHIACAMASLLEKSYTAIEDRVAACERLTSVAIDRDKVVNAAAFQDYLRAQLIKSGKPGYVAESREAFIPVEAMVALGLDLGAIPTYPVLGNPVTPWEEDLGLLFDRLEAVGIYAIEVIPDRNTPERIAAICETAAERRFPVFNGTEHNTKSEAPLVDRYFFDPELRPHFERGAKVLLAHQALRARGDVGYVDENGLPQADRDAHLRELEAIGEEVLQGAK